MQGCLKSMSGGTTPTPQKERKVRIMKWYAVQENRTDAWDKGSYDYKEAMEMLQEHGCGLIAVIEDDVCVEEIEYMGD